MVKALRALPGETRRIQLKPWLYRIAHNESVEMLRRRRESTELDPELVASGGDPSEAAATRQRLRHLLDDLGKLPQRQRSALVMRELSGLPFSHIAAAFDTTEAAIRQAVYEARLSLREIAAGREMSCRKVMWELSEADGRVKRRRDIQAHLRTCSECRAFQHEITNRRQDLAAIAPLPLVASAALLKGVLGGAGAAAGAGGGSAAGGAVLSGAAAVGGGKAAATSVALKAAATIAVVAVGATAADRGGLIETPLPASIGGDKSATRMPPDGASPGPGREPTTESSSAAGSTPDGHQGGVDPGGASKGSGSNASNNSSRASGDGSVPASVGHGPDDSAKSKERGRSESMPAASEHGQKTAAEARSTKKPKGARGKAAPSKGAGKPAAPAKGNPSQGNPSHGPSAKSKAHSSPPHEPGSGKVEPDKPRAAPFQPPKSEMSKGASSSEGA